MEKKVMPSGAKAYQRTDAEWRIKPYSDWHRRLTSNLLMLDVDFIEWRIRSGWPNSCSTSDFCRIAQPCYT